jgi:hypothetical protein
MKTTQDLQLDLDHLPEVPFTVTLVKVVDGTKVLAHSNYVTITKKWIDENQKIIQLHCFELNSNLEFNKSEILPNRSFLPN